MTDPSDFPARIGLRLLAGAGFGADYALCDPELAEVVYVPEAKPTHSQRTMIDVDDLIAQAGHRLRFLEDRNRQKDAQIIRDLLSALRVAIERAP
jgi:hypothetical protein